MDQSERTPYSRTHAVLAFIGPIGLVLFFATLIAIGSTNPPPGAGDQLVAHYQAQRANVITVALADSVAVLAIVAFAAGLCGVLRRTEGGEPLADFAFASAIIHAPVAIVAVGLAAAAAVVAAHGAPASTLAALRDAGLAVGSLYVIPRGVFIAVASMAVLRTGTLPGWIGWLGLVAGIVYGVTAVGLFGLGASEEEGPLGTAQFLSFVAFFVWMLASAIVLLRRAGRGARPGAVRSSPAAV